MRRDNPSNLSPSFARWFSLILLFLGGLVLLLGLILADDDVASGGSIAAIGGLCIPVAVIVDLDRKIESEQNQK